MQYYWLKNNNKNKLIVFFAGWSFDYFPFLNINSFDYDVLMFYDYSDLNLPVTIGEYDEKILITWSMGVFIAYYIKNLLPDFNKKIAVNGTPFPVDDRLGIPKRTFDLTLKYAETGLKGKFYENVFSNENLLNIYLKTPVQRTIENRVNELIKLDDFIKNIEINYDGQFYDTAIIGKNDKIIPAKNQLNMWGNIAKILDCGHFPFYNYNSWDEICRQI